MKEYFVFSNSFAAPFFSDSDTSFIKGNSPKDALTKYVENYKHPAGLYSAAIYENAEACHKNAKPLCTWLCNHEIGKQKATKNLGGYSFLGHEPGRFEVNHKEYRIPNPRDGKIV